MSDEFGDRQLSKTFNENAKLPDEVRRQSRIKDLDEVDQKMIGNLYEHSEQLISVRAEQEITATRQDRAKALLQDELREAARNANLAPPGMGSSRPLTPAAFEAAEARAEQRLLWQDEKMLADLQEEVGQQRDQVIDMTLDRIEAKGQGREQTQDLGLGRGRNGGDG